MLQRGLVLLGLGASLGLLFATFLQPGNVEGADAPAELLRKPAKPTKYATDLSRAFVDSTRKVRPAVVQIRNIVRDRRGEEVVQSSGSGFVFSAKGHLLTNRHVIQGAQKLEIKTPDGTILGDIEVIGADIRSDLAVLRYTGEKKLPIAELGDSDTLEVGQWVIAIGAPFDLHSSVSAGIVSARGRTGILANPGNKGADYSESFIQTDAALNPGNSGGPLIDLDGQVIGINTAIETGNQIRASVGVGFAIPINLARSIGIALIERGVAKRGWLGVRVNVWSGADLKREHGLDTPTAIVIEHVAPGSPAAAAGVRKGDVLTKFDGANIRDVRALSARLARSGPDQTVELTVVRNRKEQIIPVQLAEEPIFTFGIAVRDLDAQRASELGLGADFAAVVITDIAKKSVAAQGAEQRLYPGDVIYQIVTRHGRFRIRNKLDFEKVMQLNPGIAKIVVATGSGSAEFLLRRS
jgi:serine protease Do